MNEHHHYIYVVKLNISELIYAMTVLFVLNISHHRITGISLINNA